MNMRIALISFVAFACCVGIGNSAELRVPQTYKTIQSAIDAASDGDTVIISPGLYYENIDFLGKAITVRSTDPTDPDVVAQTIIDGGQIDSCVKFISGEGRDSMICGLTITNGRRDIAKADGGGISCIGSSPEIRNNVIHGNEARYSGGGISAMEDASPLIQDNIISANHAAMGGGVSATRGASPEIVGNLIEANTSGQGAVASTFGSQMILASNTIIGNSAYSGDAIYCYSSGASIFGNTIRSNVAYSGYWIAAIDIEMCLGKNLVVIAGNTITNNEQSAIFLFTSDPLITANVISSNNGVGIGCTGSSPLITGNLIAGNGSAGDGCGGGIVMDASTVCISNNIIAGNWGVAGAGVSFKHHHYLDHPPLIHGCTIVGNRATETGGGIWANESSSPIVVDCIVRGNSAPTGSQISLLWDPYYEYPSQLQACYSNIEGGEAGVPIRAGGTLTWGPGNIDSDPLFVDPGHWDDAGTPDDTSDDLFVLGDYHLLPGSPCIDAGTNNVDNPATTEIETLPEKDIAGVSRIMDGNLDGTATVDMGAYEYLPGDVNHDGRVNILDLIGIRNLLGQNPASVPAARLADLNCDGSVNVLDLIFARNRLNTR